MRHVKRFFYKLGNFLQPRRAEQELAREVSSHLTLLEDEFRRRGLNAEAARLAARRAYGGVEQAKELQREERSWPWLEQLRQDLRFSGRTLLRSPGFTITAVLMLALGIGANTAMFTVIHAVLLKPLAYPDSDRLVRISGSATPARWEETRKEAQAFAELGAYTRPEQFTLSGEAEPIVLTGVHVSANFLHILAVQPLLGRSFRPEEDSPGGAAVVMISAELWKQRFGGDPHIVGRTMTLAPTPYTIIGVLPSHFPFPSPDLDLWLAAPDYSSSMPAHLRALSPFLTLFGRLQHKVSLEEANAALKVIRRHYAAAHPAMLDAKPKTPVEVTAMKEELVAHVQSQLWLLAGAVGFVLLIACANVASLLLTRAASRTQEFAVRAALGAARRRLLAQGMAESLLLSAGSGAIGILLAVLLVRIIPNLKSWELPRITEIHLDGIVLVFAVALSLITSFLFGWAPISRASRPDLMNALRASGEAASPRISSRRAGWDNRSLLPAGQVALSLILLIGAALLTESMTHLRRVELGFHPANLLTVSITLPPFRYNTDGKRAIFFDELVHQMETIPGVRSAAVALSLPMMDYAGIPVQDAAKPKLKLNERLIVKWFPITPGYFRTLGVPLKRGRDFTERDTVEAPRVAIIDETLARRFWPAYPAGPDPVGQKLFIGGVNPNPAEVVGIVGHVRQNLDDRADWQESVYVSFSQSPLPAAVLVLRTAGEQSSVPRAMQARVRVLDQNQPLGAVQTMEDRVEAQIGQQRLLVGLLDSFAFFACALALIGIYGVLAYSVTQRRQELAIRRALGAQQTDILRLMIGQGVRMTLAGLAVGLAGALALTRVMNALLFHVSATDPFTFAGMTVLFLVVALIASYLPARRATRIDPMTTLRHN